MGDCTPISLMVKALNSIDQQAEIKKQDEHTRINVWDTNFEKIQDLFYKGIAMVTGLDSAHVKRKLKNFTKDLDWGSETNPILTDFETKIIKDQKVIEKSIALQEIMESIKGESDKAGTNGIDIIEVSVNGYVPNLPLPRVVESIGRKIAYQKRYRFTNNGDKNITPAMIGRFYLQEGMKAVEALAEDGYIEIHEEGKPSIKDYIDSTTGEKRQKVEVIRNIETISLNLSTILELDKDGAPEKNSLLYFTKRPKAKLGNNVLGKIVKSLKAVNLLAVPANITFPNRTPFSKEELSKFDRDYTPSKNLKETKDYLQNAPLKINTAMHSLFQKLFEEGQKTGKPAVELFEEFLENDPETMMSLFNIKRADEFSTDKEESVAGQNISKSTPFNDFIEYYDAINSDGDTNQYLGLKTGRNSRLYYWNSVLNPHASKHSRFMLTPGQSTFKVDSSEYKRVVFQIADSLGIRPAAVMGLTTQTNAEKKQVAKALSDLALYHEAKSLESQMDLLVGMSNEFPGIDFASLVTGVQAMTDLRNADSKGNITTEYAVSADATASGGNLTFMQALGTNPAIVGLLKRLGILKSEDSIEKTLDDVYGVMQESINDFLTTETKTGNRKSVQGKIAPAKKLMQSLWETLYNNDLRAFAKPPTMTFIYGQGRPSAIDSMGRQIADDLINNIGKEDSLDLIKSIITDKDILKALKNQEATDVEGLYPALVGGIIDSGVPNQLYTLMDDSIQKPFLQEHIQRTTDISNLLIDSKVGNYFNILPAFATVLDGLTADKETLKKFGVPLSKIFDFSSDVEGDRVFTRKQILSRTVMAVSTIHSMDTAQLYGAIYNAVVAKKRKTGIVVVHDDVRSSPEIVAEVEAAYVEITKQIVEGFDTHDQVLNSLLVYKPDIVNSPDYIKLRKSVDESMAAKKEILKEFDTKTSSIIGDARFKEVPSKLDDDLKQEFAEETKPKEPKKVKAKTKLKPKVKTDSEVETLVNDLANESEIIKAYTESKSKAKLVKGKDNNFDPATDTIEIATAGTNKSNLDTKTLIEHEITHSFTVGYLQKVLSRDPKNTFDVSSTESNRVKLVQKAINQVQKILIRPNELSDNTVDRMVYALGKNSEARSLNEFIAIMSTEGDVASEIYFELARSQSFPKSTIEKTKAAIKLIKEAVTKFIANVTQADLDADFVDIVQLEGAINGVIRDGQNLRENDFENTKLLQQTYEDGVLNVGPANQIHRHSLNYLNYAVASMLTTKVERSAVTLAKSANRIMSLKFPMYTQATEKLNGIYDSSEALQQIVHTVSNIGIDKLKKNVVLSRWKRLSSERNDLMASELAKFHEVMKGVSKAQSDNLYDFVHKTPLHDYFILASTIDTTKKFDDRISELEKSVSPAQNKLVDNVIARKEYSLDKFSPEDDLRELLALKSIKALGTDKFIDLLGNLELMTLVKDNSVANKISTMSFGDVSKLNDSLLPSYSKERMQHAIFSKEEIHKYEDEGRFGWKILRMPGDNAVGVAYRPVIDSTYLEGAFADIKLESTDINVPKRFKGYKDVLETRSGYKLVLSDSDKETLGVIKDPAQGLVRGTAHSLAIQDSQIIRNELLKKDTTFDLQNDGGKEELVDILETKGKDNPWFVKTGKDDYAKLDSKDKTDKALKAIYMPVGGKLSDVKGANGVAFNKEITWVRKDIAQWLIGDKKSSLSENPKLRWILRLTKSLVAGSKMGMVIVNPLKIAKDNASNIAYLAAVGIDPIYIQKQYRSILKEYKDYTDIKESLIHMRIKQVAQPENKALQAKFKAQQKKLVGSKVHSVYKKGFVNSLGTNLIHQNADTLSGMQADLQRALEFLLKDSKGETNFLGRYIRDISRLGFNGEDFLNYVAKTIKRTPSLEGFGKGMDGAADRIRGLKNDGDIVNYTSQFIITPNSESIKIGSYATDLTDVLAKETYYRYLTEEEGMSDGDAITRVIDSFPDYKENMPIAIKQLSDMGILMFPTFWMRIQKVIYRLARDKPINLALELQIENMVGVDLEHIIDANIISKSTEFGGIFHSPHEFVGLNSIFPMHVIP